MLIALNHLCEIVIRPREEHAFLLEKNASFFGAVETLFVKGQFAVEVVVDVGNGDLGGGDQGLVLGEG